MITNPPRQHVARASNQRGSATVMLMSVAAMILAAGVAAVLWAAVSTAHHRATAAADLAALSAAQAALTGGDPCRSAGRIAVAHRSVLRHCEIEGDVVRVVVGVPVELGSLGRPQVRSAATAGPITAGSAESDPPL